MLSKSKARMYETGRVVPYVKKVRGKYKPSKRGMFRIPVGDIEVKYYPARFWRSGTGLTEEYIKNIIKANHITCSTADSLLVLSKGEMEIIRYITVLHKVSSRKKHTKTPEYLLDLRSSLNTLRTDILGVSKGLLPEQPVAYQAYALSLDI